MQTKSAKRCFVFSVLFLTSINGFYCLPAYCQSSGSWQLSDPLPKPSGGSGVESNAPPEQVWVWVENSAAAESSLQPQQFSQALTVPQVLPSPSPQIGFNGVVASSLDGTPPDTHIAVGPGAGNSGRVIMVTNGQIEIWDKTGAVVGSPVRLSTFFGASCFDPRVIYDDHSGRFFIACLEGTTTSGSNIHIAVSSGSTPSSLTTGWTTMTASALTTIGIRSTWADFTNLGADDDSVIVTANLFDTFNFFAGVKIRVFNKSSLLAGSQVYTDINYNNTSTPAFSVAPAHVYGTTDNGGFYLICRLSATSYRLFNITGDPTSPSATSGVYSWSTGADPSANGAPQRGTSVPLDTSDGRVMSPVYRNGHIWLCLTADPDNDGLTEAVWQDILTNGGAAPSVNQGGYLKGTLSSYWTYMPSIAVNSAGDAAICFTQSSSAEYPDVVYAVRAAGDITGTFRTPIIAKAGPGYYYSFAYPSQANPDRWGDYSGCVVDPTNDSFWAANEFAATSGAANSLWATFIANVNAPITGDFNVDGNVDFVDFAMFASAWLNTSAGPNWNPVFDISTPRDNAVNWKDMAIFAQNWLKGF